MPIQTALFDLTGKGALVTGGATGIGRALTAGLAAHGARVLIGSRRAELVEQAASELNADIDEPRVFGTRLDVTDNDSVEAAVHTATERLGSLDILINCAGIQLRKPAIDLTPEEFNHMYDVHATGSLRCAQAAARVFIPQGSGSIINVASICSFVDNIEVSAYAAAKSAVLGLTRSLANEWVKHGVRTNAIAPGFVVTDLNRQNLVGTDRGRRILERTPAARFGQTSEMAGTAVYLASPAAAFVNGQTIVVDGGFLACGFTDSVAGEQ
jgi:NAD(P)-dependent dehydrogenase (short-subunit alcohol dehydrogenase family)